MKYSRALQKTDEHIAICSAQKNLRDALHVLVDLVTEQSLSPYLKDKALKDMQTVYGTR